MVEFGEDGAGIVGADDVRVSVGDARGEVVSFVEEQQGAGGVEAGLVVEKRAVGGGEDVVVVADPDIVEGEGGAGDFVRADAGVAAGGAECVEVARVVFVDVETGEAGGGPTLGEVVEVGAGFADAVEDGVDAVLGFIADMPGRDGRRGRVGGERGVERSRGGSGRGCGRRNLDC